MNKYLKEIMQYMYGATYDISQKITNKDHVYRQEELISWRGLFPLVDL